MGYKNNIFRDGLLTGIGRKPTAEVLEVGGNLDLTSGFTYKIGGLDINTKGTLSNVAYLNQANTFTEDQLVEGNIGASFNNSSTVVIGIGTDGSFGSGKTGIFRFADSFNQITNSYGGTMKGESYHGWQFYNASGEVARIGLASSDNSSYFLGSVRVGSDGTPVESLDVIGNGKFSGTITALDGNSTNWNTAYGWGNHAGLYSLLNHTHTFASLTSKPTTISGYGITDYNSLWDVRLSTKTTTNLTEGTSLYYTESRVNANTNVTANTNARHNAVTIGTANGLILSTQVLSLGLASASTNGALSSTNQTIGGVKIFADEIVGLGGNEYGYGGDVAFDAFPGETTQGIRVLGTDEYIIPFLGAPHIEGQGNLGAGTTNSRAGVSTYIETAKYNFTTDDQIPYGVLWLRRQGKAYTSLIAKTKDEASSHISSRLKVGYLPSDNYGDQTDMNTLSVYGNINSEEVITTDATREEIEAIGLKAIPTIGYLKTGNINSPDVKFSRVFGYGNASGNHFVASFDGTVLSTNATRTTFNGSDQITGQGNLAASTYYSGYNIGVTTNSAKKTIDDQIPVAIFWASQDINEGIKPVEIIAHQNKGAGASSISSRLQIGYTATSAGADQTNMFTLAVNGTINAVGDITAASFLESSLRELKTNIKPFNKSGLDLVNELNIVEYNKKDNLDVDKVGIIIDESPEEFANKEQTAVDLYKTIFVQAKAIQELSERLEELEKLLG